MAFGLPTEYSIGAQDAQIQALEECYGSIPVYATYSGLPDAVSLADGRCAMVLELLQNGQPGFVLVRSGQWVIPAGAVAETISFVGKVGAGTGELPQNVVVASGATGVLGVGWALEPTQTIARPSGVAVTPINPSSVEIGARGAGIWRLAAAFSYSIAAPASSQTTRFFLQRDRAGSGFIDFGPELTRLEQESPSPIAGITQTALGINASVEVGDKYRIVVRHTSSQTLTYTFQAFSVEAQQFVSETT